MPDPAILTAFVGASLAVLLIPGPGVVYVVTLSAARGTRAGLATAAGLSLGALAQAAGAGLGLGAVLAASAEAFTLVKLAGAGYLIYLGLRCLFARTQTPPDEPAASLPRVSARRLVMDGVVVSLLNPKIALFFLAYLPQFTDPARGDVAGQIALLGALYAGLALVTDGGYAVLAGRLRPWLMRRRAAWARLSGRVTGVVYIALGIQASLAERRG